MFSEGEQFPLRVRTESVCDILGSRPKPPKY